MNSEEREALAKQRFMLLNLTRFVSIAMVMLGMVIISGRLLKGYEFVGYVILLLGVAEFFLMPVIFKKRWASEDADKG
jgi:Na+/melibiose symporter-like transporter